MKQTCFSAQAAIVMLATLLTYCSGSFADVFEHTPPQRVFAGETLSLVLRLSSESPTETTVSIVDPKANMTLTRMTRNKYMLRWHTPASLQAEQIIVVQASLTGPPASVEKHNIVIRSSEIQQTDLTTPEKIPAPDARVPVLSTDRYTRPKIKGIPTQIITAGKIVKIKVIAPVENGRNADISVDVLPPDALIDIGNDGIPVFIWYTTETDRGEHRFVFTATHPSMAELQDTAEAFVIIENTTTSGASDNAVISEPPQTSQEPAYPDDNTGGSEAVNSSPPDDGMGPEDANYFADPTPPPTSYPAESPPGYSPENQPGYPTNGPPGSSPDNPPGLPPDSPPGYSPYNQPGYSTDGPPTGYFPGPQPSGSESPPPQ